MEGGSTNEQRECVANEIKNNNIVIVFYVMRAKQKKESYTRYFL